MTAPPQVNGHKSPAMPIVWDWRPVTQPEPPTQEPTEVPPTPQVEPAPAAPAVDHVALAEADAIRKRADAEAEALRIKAEGEAAALVAKAEAETEKQRLANERNAMRLEKERADHDARIAESNRRREESERATRAAREAEEGQQATEAEQEEKVRKSESLWMKAALGFAIACAVVALPVQMAAFYDPEALWLLAAPLMLEGGAWIVLSGAAAAVAGHRPHWHYRGIAWLLAFVAAGINLWHGIHAFDPATAGATAFASLAGPGIWDLHEHGRIRKRDGVLSRKERKAQESAARAEKKEKAAAEAAAKAEKEAAEQAAADAAAQLAADRERDYPAEWKYALRLASAQGEIGVTEAVWERAWDDLHAAKPGVTANSISARNAAAQRLSRVLERAPENTPSKTTNAQRAIQIKSPSRRSSYRPVPPVRKTGDTPPYHRAARLANGETKRRINAAKTIIEEQS
jgi:hypothetical protein